MSKTAEISVLTANRLGDGIVVFLDFEGAWSEGIEAAAIARSPDEARALEARGAHDAAHNLVVEPYLIEVREVGGSLAPIRYRERVRVAGPSILDDVPGYVEPIPSSRLPREEGQGEELRYPAPPASHPNPLPIQRDGERVRLVEAA
jgi:uncharacterized protein DUF2849